MQTLKTIDMFDAETMGRIIFLNAGEYRIKIAACVVDVTGCIISSWRDPDCKPASVDVAAAKAITALRNRVATIDFLRPKDAGGRGWTAQDVANAQAAHAQFIAWGGGVPIMVDGQCVGAIAVSGGTEQQDHDLCVLAASCWPPCDLATSRGTMDQSRWGGPCDFSDAAGPALTHAHSRLGGVTGGGDRTPISNPVGWRPNPGHGD